MSYRKRVTDINRIYDEWSHSGLSNREIWRRYIYPIYAISERTLYNMLKAPILEKREVMEQGFLFTDFFNKEDEQRNPDYYKAHTE